MKKIVYGLVAMLMAMAGTTASAQDIYGLENQKNTLETEKELSRQEQRALQQKIDSVQWAEAVAAMKDSTFTLEADQVIFKYGQKAYVSSSTNFVRVNKDRATVQVAFNIPVAGPNGMGGVTLDGRVSSYKMFDDKNGKLTRLEMNVMGIGISSRLVISMYKDSNKAQVDVLPNFNSNRISLSGVVLPNSQSFVVKGMAL